MVAPVIFGKPGSRAFPRLLLLPLLVASAVVGIGCASMEVPADRAVQLSLATAETGLVYEFARSTTTGLNPNESGLLLLSSNDDALSWRLALIDSAVDSIDAQYFIWDSDFAGLLLLGRLIDAADRGVRVRLLVDDVFLTHSDRELSALSSHPNFEVRVFNPYLARRSMPAKALNFAFNFRKLNRRMHNKLFIVDGQVAILGGRNIGNAYFGLSSSFNFRDLDTLVTGSELPTMLASFDEYWNSPYAYSGDPLHVRGGWEYFLIFRTRIHDVVSSDPLSKIVDTGQKDWAPFFERGVEELVPGNVRYIYDHPTERADRRVGGALTEFLAREQDDVILVTPYLIPDNDVLDGLQALVNRGTRVRVLVPSMASNNHTVAHSQYRKYRARLLRKGVDLYEYRHQPQGVGPGYIESDLMHARFVSLHMKAMVGGDSYAFVGSLNLDSRALRLDTESGLFIESEEYSERLRGVLEPMLSPQQAWLVENSRLGYIWTSEIGSSRRQPARSWFQRLADAVYWFLPLRPLL